jgi:hypothetical protein
VKSVHSSIMLCVYVCNKYQATWRFSHYILAVIVQQKLKMQVYDCEYTECNFWLFQLGTMCRTKIASPLLASGQECNICFVWQPPTVLALQWQNTQWLHLQWWEVISSNVFKLAVPMPYLCYKSYSYFDWKYFKTFYEEQNKLWA